jgi:hypothetical protein
MDLEEYSPSRIFCCSASIVNSFRGKSSVKAVGDSADCFFPGELQEFDPRAVKVNPANAPCTKKYRLFMVG